MLTDITLCKDTVSSIVKAVLEPKKVLSAEQPQKFFDTQYVLDYVGYSQMRQMYSKHFQNIGDNWEGRSTEQVQHFLQELLSIPNLEVVSVQSYTRKDGWPGWVYGYRIID